VKHLQPDTTKKPVPRQRFKELRKLKGTQLKVAQDRGTTEVTVRSLENGYSNPSVKSLFAWARYFETDVYDLFPDIANAIEEECGNS
jgi:transcriptional regulator with XRE-family HTH domain